jgi:hypothetical protein
LVSIVSILLGYFSSWHGNLLPKIKTSHTWRCKELIWE